MKFRKKPVAVDAWPISDVVRDIQNLRMLDPHLSQALTNNLIMVLSGGLSIVTLEGVMWAQPTDILIMGIAGEFYCCKPDIFAATYDKVE